MRSNTPLFGTLIAAVLAATTGIVAGSALAQEATTEEIESITVEAARPGRSTIGAPINVVTTQRVISFADISLTTPAGVKVLENRIREAALSACNELTQKYPVTLGNPNDCINNAIEGAMADASRAIETAREANPQASAAFVPVIEAREEVIVEGVRGSRSTIGAPIQDVSATRTVSFKDISLTTATGPTVLENRIKEAARAACNELEQKYPVAAEGDNAQKCYDNAVASAMVVARRAVAAAKLTARTN